MPMPKGTKVGNYVTLSDRQPMQFRRIAQVMSSRGDTMNHASARGILMNGMKKIARSLLRVTKGSATDDDVDRLVRSETFQSFVGDVLEEIEMRAGDI